MISFSEMLTLCTDVVENKSFIDAYDSRYQIQFYLFCNNNFTDNLSKIQLIWLQLILTFCAAEFVCYSILLLFFNFTLFSLFLFVLFVFVLNCTLFVWFIKKSIHVDCPFCTQITQFIYVSLMISSNKVCHQKLSTKTSLSGWFSCILYTLLWRAHDTLTYV